MAGALIGHGRPEDVTWAVLSGTADTDPATLDNGRVGDETAISWPDEGTAGQTTSTHISITADWSVAQPVRIVCVLGLRNIDAGTRITLGGRRVTDGAGVYSYGLGGNSDTTTFQFPDGSVGAWFILPTTNTDLVGLKIAIYNNKSGVTYLTDNEFVYVGEIGIFQAFQPQIVRAPWTYSQNTVNDQRAVNNQPWVFSAQPYRTIGVTLMSDYVNTFGEFANFGAIDNDELSVILNSGDPVCFVANYNDAAGVLDTWNLHRRALFGFATRVGKPQLITDSKQFYELTVQFTESPARV